MSGGALAAQPNAVVALESIRRRERRCGWVPALLFAFAQPSFLAIQFAHRSGHFPSLVLAYTIDGALLGTLWISSEVRAVVLRRRREKIAVQLCAAGGTEAFWPLMYELFMGRKAVQEQVRQAVASLAPGAWDSATMLTPKQLYHLAAVIDTSVRQRTTGKDAAIIQFAGKWISRQGGATELRMLEETTERARRARCEPEVLLEIDDCVNTLRRRITRRLPNLKAL